jgi:hypothetical protein
MDQLVGDIGIELQVGMPVDTGPVNDLTLE